MECLLTCYFTLLFQRWGYIDNIIPSYDERTNLLNLSLLLFLRFIKHEVHMNVISLENTPYFSPTFERYNNGLSVQHLIQNIQRPFGHNNTLSPSLWSNICV